jgi:hypothetical protein
MYHQLAVCVNRQAVGLMPRSTLTPHNNRLVLRYVIRPPAKILEPCFKNFACVRVAQHKSYLHAPELCAAPVNRHL